MSSTKRKLVALESSNGYWDGLPASLKDSVSQLVCEAYRASNGPDGWKDDKECLHEVECRSRSGFMPFSHNKGGVQYQNFVTLMDYHASGVSPAHVKAAEWIQKRCDEAYEEMPPTESDSEEGEAYLEALQLADDSLSDENSTVMHDIRIMYHGEENGVHTASVSAAINVEAPYHRSHISWAPNVFCEGAKEIEIYWTTEAECVRKIKAALKKVTKEVF